MYANALPWDEKEEKKLLKEAPNEGHIQTIVTPLHKMYAKVAKMALNQKKKLMMLDKTGSGLVQYNDLVEDCKGVTIDQSSEDTGVCNLLTNVRDFAVTAIGNKVYVSGGYDMVDESPVNALIVYDGYTGEWRLLSAMKKNRCNHTMVLWKGGLLVTGGETNSNKSITSSCELYSTEKDRWITLDPLIEPRYCHACVVHKDNVLVSGGLGVTELPQTNIWIYELTTSKWMHLDEDYPVTLPYSLAKHSMISHYDSIYIVGGITNRGTEHMRSLKATPKIISFKPTISYLGSGALCDNIDKNKYDRVTPWSHDHKALPEPLYNSIVLRIGNDIMVLGGTSDSGRNSNFIAYGLEHNSLQSTRFHSKTHSRGLPFHCGGVTLEKTSRKSLEQLVPRNWPLW